MRIVKINLVRLIYYNYNKLAIVYRGFVHFIFVS